MTVQTLTEAVDPHCLSDHELLDLARSLPYRRFGVIGDSLSAGTGDPSPGYRSAGWSRRVADLLGRAHPDASSVNLAVVGARTPEVTDAQLDRVLAFGPDLLHVPSGANDLLTRTPDWTRIEHDLRALWGAAASGGGRLTAFTFGRAFVLPAFADWSERVVRLNAIVRALSQEHAAVLVDMWDHPVNDRPDLVSADGVHFAAAGQAVLATEVVRHLALAQ